MLRKIALFLIWITFVGYTIWLAPIDRPDTWPWVISLSLLASIFKSIECKSNIDSPNTTRLIIETRFLRETGFLRIMAEFAR